MDKCVQPDAPWVRCCVCGKRIKTCEREEPIMVKGYPDYICPTHPDGVGLLDGRWVCSDACWDTVVDGPEPQQSSEEATDDD